MDNRNHVPRLKFSGRFYFTQSGAITQNAFNLNPLVFDDRCLQVSDQFQLYRFTSVTVRHWGTNTLYPLALGYSPTLASTPPSTVQHIMDAEVASIGNGQVGSPWPTIKLNKQMLIKNSSPKWWRRGTAYDDLLELQGQVYYASPGASYSAQPGYFLVRYTIEFAAPADASTTVSRFMPDAEMSRRLAQVREQEELKAEATIQRVEAAKEPREPDPVLDKIKALLVRDDMVVVTQGDLPRQPVRK